MSAPPTELIDTGQRVLPDETHTIGAPMPIVDNSDPNLGQRMKLMELSGVLDFWDDPEEDIYSPEDGSPI